MYLADCQLPCKHLVAHSTSRAALIYCQCLGETQPKGSTCLPPQVAGCLSSRRPCRTSALHSDIKSKLCISTQTSHGRARSVTSAAPALALPTQQSHSKSPNPRQGKQNQLIPHWGAQCQYLRPHWGSADQKADEAADVCRRPSKQGAEDAICHSHCVSNKPPPPPATIGNNPRQGAAMTRQSCGCSPVHLPERWTSRVPVRLGQMLRAWMPAQQATSAVQGALAYHVIAVPRRADP